MIDVNKLKGRIVSAGHSQRSLAKEMGMNKNTLNSKVNGQSSFTVEEVERLCALIGIESATEKCDIFFASSVPEVG